MRSKKLPLILGLGLAATLAAGAAWAVLYPSQPGDNVYYRDENNQVVGHAWISCYTTEVRQEGILTGNAVKTHFNCPPPTN